MNSNELAKARATIIAALGEDARKEYEDRLRGIPSPPSKFPFPNFDAGPHRSPPIHLNFYRINDHYPDYLLCQYDVDEKNYSQSNEPSWIMAAAMALMRRT